MHIREKLQSHVRRRIPWQAAPRDRCEAPEMRGPALLALVAADVGQYCQAPPPTPFGLLEGARNTVWETGLVISLQLRLLYTDRSTSVIVSILLKLGPSEYDVRKTL